MKLLLVILASLFFCIGALDIQANGHIYDPVSTVDSLKADQINWHLLDPEGDNIQGTSVYKVWQELLVGKKPKKTVVVAVIDSGIDIWHEDLKGKIWTNEKEIPGNGIDDDNNGYVDDVHGWNFIGNSEGENVEHETLEYVRIIRKFEGKYDGIKSESELPINERRNYRDFVESKKKYAKELSKYQSEHKDIELFEKTLNASEKLVMDALEKDEYSIQDLLTLNSTDQKVNAAKLFLLNVLNSGFTHDALNEIKDYYHVRMNKHLNLSFNPRSIINDDPYDITDTDYGNDDVKGPRSDHGTFVAGIIAANRDNGIGIDGIAEDVRIMVLRVVPDGDEYDKDVALAIRYAVDNGAHIINMSFGKEFSPQKSMVDDAFRYAVENNVLLVHAAGNSATNIDKEAHYPTAKLDDNTVAASVITVGAISKNLNYHLLGNFTNYGREEVDIFAPGVDMVSLYPGDKYNVGSGTSFASPIVAGVAALIWSYYPELTAIQLKDVLLNSALRYPRQKVYLPNDTSSKKKKVRFKKLSKTGGIVNAYEAFRHMEKLVEEIQVVNSN
jgi:subtilisin family serine protease